MRIPSFIKESFTEEFWIDIHKLLREGPSLVFFAFLIINLILQYYKLDSDIFRVNLFYFIAMVITYMFTYIIIMDFVYMETKQLKIELFSYIKEQKRILSLIKTLKPRKTTNIYSDLEYIIGMLERSNNEDEVMDVEKSFNDMKYKLVKRLIMTIFIIDLLLLFFHDNSILMLILKLILGDYYYSNM